MTTIVAELVFYFNIRDFFIPVWKYFVIEYEGNVYEYYMDINKINNLYYRRQFASATINQIT